MSKRLELYFEATTCAAIIAVSENKAEVIAAKEKFWILYWGPMSVIEDKDVEGAMMNFSEALKSGDPDSLRVSAYSLAHACRNSLKASWQVEDKHSAATSTGD